MSSAQQNYVLSINFKSCTPSIKKHQWKYHCMPSKSMDSSFNFRCWSPLASLYVLIPCKLITLLATMLTPNAIVVTRCRRPILLLSWYWTWRCINSYLVLVSRSTEHSYASPSSGEAYRDRQLTTNFELWVEKFFVHRHATIWGFQNPVCLSVPREQKSPELRQYQSYISNNLNWYINGKVFTSTTPLKPKNLNFFQKCLKFEFWLVTKRWNHLSFVNISPTLVIDASMERSSQVLQHLHKYYNMETQ